MALTPGDLVLHISSQAYWAVAPLLVYEEERGHKLDWSIMAAFYNVTSTYRHHQSGETYHGTIEHNIFAGWCDHYWVKSCR